MLNLPPWRPRASQVNLFRSPPKRRPVYLANGLGVNSFALSVLLCEAGIEIGANTFADTGVEKDETYKQLPLLNAYLKRQKQKPVTVVTYTPKRRQKHVPAQRTLGEMCLSNCTLPSVSYPGGRKTCSAKMKIAPQNAFDAAQSEAQATWEAGEKVARLIGFDYSKRDQKRYGASKTLQGDEKYLYLSPLHDLKIDREGCKKIISDAGLEIPPKSACLMCASTQPEELYSYKMSYLIYIVATEARAEAYLTSSEGLWIKTRKGTRGTTPRPGKMTNFIRENGLLTEEMIDHIVTTIPKGRVTHQEAAAGAAHVSDWLELIESYLPEDEVMDPYLLPGHLEFEEAATDIVEDMNYFCGGQV